MSVAPTVTASIGDLKQDGNFVNLNATGSVTGLPWTGVFTGNGTSVVNAKLFAATATTNGGQVTFYPTTTGTSTGTNLFTNLLTVQAMALLQTTSGSKVPVTSLYSASPTSIVVNAIIPYSGAAVANGTYVTCMVIGT